MLHLELRLEISSGKFLETYSYSGNFQKIFEKILQELSDLINLRNNCVFAYNDTFQRFLARDSMLSALYAIANPSVRLSVTRVDQSKTVEARIMQFSPYSSPIPLVFAG